jgi:hypothetical protein
MGAKTVGVSGVCMCMCMCMCVARVSIFLLFFCSCNNPTMSVCFLADGNKKASDALSWNNVVFPVRVPSERNQLTHLAQALDSMLQDAGMESDFPPVFLERDIEAFEDAFLCLPHDRLFMFDNYLQTPAVEEVEDDEGGYTNTRAKASSHPKEKAVPIGDANKRHSMAEILTLLEVYETGMHEVSRQIWTQSRERAKMVLYLLERMTVLWRALLYACQAECYDRWKVTYQGLTRTLEMQNENLYKERIVRHQVRACVCECMCTCCVCL